MSNAILIELYVPTINASTVIDVPIEQSTIIKVSKSSTCIKCVRQMESKNKKSLTNEKKGENN